MTKWAMKACEGGGKAAHAFTKGPRGWAGDPTCELTTDPPHNAPGEVLQQADAELQAWKAVWSIAKLKVQRDHWPSRAPALWRPTPQEVREAGSSFRWSTALGGDDFHPRFFQWLSDEALEAYIDLMTWAEEAMQVPEQLDLLVIILLDKPQGGRRPIGLFC